MTAFLTAAWCDRLRDEWQALPHIDGATAEGGLTVTKGPSGDQRLQFVIEDGVLRSTDIGPDPDSPLDLSCPYAVAMAIASGETSVSVAFMRGLLKVSGDMKAMHRILPLTDDEPFGELLATLAAETEF